MRIKRADQLDQTEDASGLVAAQSSENANIDSWLRILCALKDKSRQKKRIASRAPVSQRSARKTSDSLTNCNNGRSKPRRDCEGRSKTAWASPKKNLSKIVVRLGRIPRFAIISFCSFSYVR